MIIYHVFVKIYFFMYMFECRRICKCITYVQYQ